MNHKKYDVMPVGRAQHERSC